MVLEGSRKSSQYCWLFGAKSAIWCWLVLYECTALHTASVYCAQRMTDTAQRSGRLLSCGALQKIRSNIDSSSWEQVLYWYVICPSQFAFILVNNKGWGKKVFFCIQAYKHTYVTIISEHNIDLLSITLSYIKYIVLHITTCYNTTYKWHQMATI